MPETLMTADGAALDLDAAERDFARAMAAPEPSEPQAPAPPKRAVDPEAPYGRTVNGRPKVRPGGRPPKPRVTEAAPAASSTAKGKVAAEPANYTGRLGEFTSALWMVLAGAPVPNDGLRLKIRAQARILKEHQGGVCQGVNLMAQHNSVIRRGVEALTMGSAGWVLPAVMAVTPFAVQTGQLWRTDATDAGLQQLAAETESEWRTVFADLQQQMGLAPAQAPEDGPGPDQDGEA